VLLLIFCQEAFSVDTKLQLHGIIHIQLDLLVTKYLTRKKRRDVTGRAVEGKEKCGFEVGDDECDVYMASI